MKNVVLQDGRYLPQVDIPNARVRGKHSAWMSIAPNRADARTHHQQRNGAFKAPLCKGSLWFVRPESPSVFPDKHCFCGHKSELRILLSYSLFNLAQVKRFIFVQFFLVVFLCKIINHFAHSFIIITEFYVVVCVKINMLGFFNQII